MECLGALRKVKSSLERKVTEKARGCVLVCSAGPIALTTTEVETQEGLLLSQSSLPEDSAH